MNMVLDSEIVKKYGFPEAVVMDLIATAPAKDVRNKDGWVKMTVEDMFKLGQESVGRSTLRAAINVLTREGLILKGRPANTGDHPMDRTCWYKLAERKVSKKRGK